MTYVKPTTKKSMSHNGTRVVLFTTPTLIKPTGSVPTAIYHQLHAFTCHGAGSFSTTTYHPPLLLVTSRDPFSTSFDQPPGLHFHSETPPGENQNLFATLTVRTYVWIVPNWTCNKVRPKKYGAPGTASCIPKQTLSFT